MGLFGKKKEELPPTVGRQDFASAISGAVGDEMRYLRYGQEEIAYLEAYFGQSVPADESVLAICSSSYPTNLSSHFGAIVTTQKRIVAAIGEQYKGGRLVGEPTLYEFPLAHVSVATQPWGNGFLGTFEMPRQNPIQLEVAHDMSRGQRFFNIVNQQITSSL